MAVYSDLIESVEPSRVASTIEKHQNDSVSEEVDDVTASRVESETVHVIHSTLKLQDSIDEAPEQRTDIELNPRLKYRPKVNLESDHGGR